MDEADIISNNSSIVVQKQYNEADIQDQLIQQARQLRMQMITNQRTNNQNALQSSKIELPWEDQTIQKQQETEKIHQMSNSIFNQFAETRAIQRKQQTNNHKQELQIEQQKQDQSSYFDQLNLQKYDLQNYKSKMNQMIYYQNEYNQTNQNNEKDLEQISIQQHVQQTENKKVVNLTINNQSLNLNQQNENKYNKIINKEIAKKCKDEQIQQNSVTQKVKSYCIIVMVENITLKQYNIKFKQQNLIHVDVKLLKKLLSKQLNVNSSQLVLFSATEVMNDCQNMCQMYEDGVNQLFFHVNNKNYQKQQSNDIPNNSKSYKESSSEQEPVTSTIHITDLINGQFNTNSVKQQSYTRKEQTNTNTQNKQQQNSEQIPDQHNINQLLNQMSKEQNQFSTLTNYCKYSNQYSLLDFI